MEHLPEQTETGLITESDHIARAVHSCNSCFNLPTRMSKFLFNLFEKELFIRVTVHVFCERLSFCACASFPFGFKGVDAGFTSSVEASSWFK